MNPQLELIRSRAPDWATVKVRKNELAVAACVSLPSGRTDAVISLRVWAAGGRVHVSEKEPRQWPEGCPERHINKNGTFCLGVGDPVAPATIKDSEHWWSWLRQYILDQRIAERKGIWPRTRALHHGNAALYQLMLERVSRGTCFADEVQLSLQSSTGWLAGDIPRLSKDGKRLVNLRAPCPRGCSRRRKPILRRNCDHKEVVFNLVKNERLRRKEEEQFWASFQGTPCCETMRSCPLRNQSKT